MHLIFLGKKIWGNKFRMLRLTLSLCFPFNPWPRIESSIAFRCHVPWVSINLEKYPCLSVSFMALILLEKIYVETMRSFWYHPLQSSLTRFLLATPVVYWLCHPCSRVRTLASIINACTHLLILLNNREFQNACCHSTSKRKPPKRV